MKSSRGLCEEINVFIIAAFLTVGFPAIGNTASIGLADPWVTNSWAQRFQEDGWWFGTHYNFDKIKVVMVSGSTAFEMPPGGMDTFSAAGWTSITSADMSGGGKSVVSSGSATSYMQWDFHFTGTQADSFAFDY